MRRTWDLTDMELLVLWESLGEEYLPAPLIFAARAEYWDEYMADKAHARENLRDRGLELDDVLKALRHPDIRIEVSGRGGADGRAATGVIRLLGARRDGLGYLVTQRPGETWADTAGYTITEFYAEEMTAEVVAALPDTGAGRRRDVVLTERENQEGMDYRFDMVPGREKYQGSVFDRAAEFLAVPTASVGTISVIQGRSVFGPRGITRYRLKWRDRVDDGRYLILGENPPLAVPADRKRVLAEVEARIAEVDFALDDERV